MVLQGLVEYYTKVKNDADPRIVDWLLVREPLWVILLVIGYLFIVINGPKWMKNREAFGLRKVLVGYNVVLVALSGWMMYGYYAHAFQNPKFNIYCEPIKTENRDETRMKLLGVAWWYFFSKVIEFGDTFFFILRKKNNQITFLHVYHHSSMFLLEWCAFRSIPDGVTCVGSFLNCFIHVVMYGYYLLAALGPFMQKYLWWKRYLTRMQIIQFVAIFLHNTYATYLDCGFPRFWNWVIWLYMSSLFILFMNFHNKSYVKSKTAMEDEPKKDKVN